MNNTIRIQARVFPVTIRDERAGTKSEDTIVLTKEQLQAAQLVGEDHKALIYRIYNRQGYKVLDIGRPIKRELAVDLFASGTEVIAEATADLPGKEPE